VRSPKPSRVTIPARRGRGWWLAVAVVTVTAGHLALWGPRLPVTAGGVIGLHVFLVFLAGWLLATTDGAIRRVRAAARARRPWLPGAVPASPLRPWSGPLPRIRGGGAANHGRAPPVPA
jgi:hypothetical protein